MRDTYHDTCQDILKIMVEYSAFQPQVCQTYAAS